VEDGQTHDRNAVWVPIGRPARMALTERLGAEPDSRLTW
jgi:hypothetical protein